jgi:metal-dependent amidase/aminoacylase/carboxypeptidase family protein
MSFSAAHICGVLKIGPGKGILLRAELDALPIEEKIQLPYASKTRMKDALGQEVPVMHTCGQDIHIVCLMASLRPLKSAENYWSGTVIAILQPNEGIPGGAQAVLNGGLYEMIPDPDLMLAQHVGMPKAVLVAVRTGPVLPAYDYIEIKNAQVQWVLPAIFSPGFKISFKISTGTALPR